VLVDDDVACDETSETRARAAYFFCLFGVPMKRFAGLRLENQDGLRLFFQGFSFLERGISLHYLSLTGNHSYCRQIRRPVYNASIQTLGTYFFGGLMMKIFATALMFLVLAGTLSAQQDPEGDRKTTIMIQQEQPEKLNFYSIRVGAWFPKDWEQDFSFKDAAINKVESEVDQSQALGLDFHFRRHVGYPVYVDLAVSAWYSSYVYKLRTSRIPEAGEVLQADSWVVIVPLTLGLSIAPLPDNPFQPYVMGGAGVYFGITGQSLKVSLQNEATMDKSEIALGWYLGAGFDFLLTAEFGVSAALKYQAIEFKEAMYTGQKDFTGMQVMAGIVLKL
jgi:hypothetical protein